MTDDETGWTVHELPDPGPPRILGVNTRTYPKQGTEYPEHGGFDLEGSTVLVVLVAGDPRVGDYAAYAGAGSPEWVARHGDKIGFAEACVHFPGQLEADHYLAR